MSAGSRVEPWEQGWGSCLSLGGKLHPGVGREPPSCGAGGLGMPWGCAGARGGTLGVCVQTGNGSTEQTQLSRDTARVERETASTNRVFMANRKASAVHGREVRDDP